MAAKAHLYCWGEIEKDTGSGRTRAENSDKLQGSIFIP